MAFRTPHSALRTRNIILAATLLVSALMAIGPSFSSAPLARAATAGPDPNSPFGVAGVMRWPSWGSMDQPAKAMLDTGGSWVREDFVWGLIEPRQGQFQWEATDRMVQALRAQNLNILGIIGYSTNWATPTKDDDASSNPDSRYAPDNGKFYWYVRALVSRYKNFGPPLGNLERAEQRWPLATQTRWPPVRRASQSRLPCGQGSRPQPP